MSMTSKHIRRGISKAEVIRLDETMRGIIQGDGPKPIALIDEERIVPIRNRIKSRAKRAKRAKSALKDAGIQTGETLDRAI
jgi:hypothetical protein